MRALLQGSLRSKVLLAVLATTLLALALSAVGLALYDVRAYRAGWAEDLRTQAEILALSTAPALAFHDRQMARENLSALRARAPILSAAVYDAGGALFAAFSRDAAHAPAARLAAAGLGHRIDDDEIVLRSAVVASGERLGTVELRARYDLAPRLTRYMLLLALTMLGSVLVALLLLARFLRSVTEPLTAVADVARRVMSERNYGLRARKTTNDEVGVLVDAFNGMLGQIEQHSGALETANRALRTEMAVRQHAEAHRELLLREISHRLKNALALVQSIAAQTRRMAATPEQFHEAFAARLHALARVHDLLTREGWESTSLEQVARETLSPYEQGEYCGRISLTGTAVIVEPTAAVTLSMILHELATNAAKYGALSNAAGRVQVTWSVARNQDDARVRLAWLERGGPRTSPPAHQGFGSRLLQSGIRELDGTTAIEYTPEGIEVRLEWRALAATSALAPGIDLAAAAGRAVGSAGRDPP